ncbi:MAG: DEAD/DEAH box helicase [Amaricoccus sp.]
MTGKDRVPATLAHSMRARGFTTLTPVQTAILDVEAAAADLLVSARTGSGKTVAIGLALARSLLDPDGILAPGAGPRALVLTPTRELASQVQAEFGWLFAGTGARIGSATGGRDPALERAALADGLDILVGTPGRLCDHLRSGAFAAEAIEAVVLDEADDMLALGFREQVEAILAALPAARRTLMVSATVTPAIEALAARYQTAAERIDIDGASATPEGIRFEGVLVGRQDAHRAVVNILCLHGPSSALVFCGRRESVGQLALHLTARGFRVVALSGDLSQKERNAALAAMRDGRARVCVATDLAARGLDLPGLDLVIHADLPANRETLLHRSGRTGRAGRGGLAILVVPHGLRRRAESLISQAGLALDWRAVPRGPEIEAGEQARMLAHVEAIAGGGAQERATVAALLAACGVERIAAAFVRLWRAGRPRYEEFVAPPPQTAPSGGIWFSVNLGNGSRTEIGTLLPLICRVGAVRRRDIGRIRVLDGETQFEVRRAAARGFAAAAGGSRPDGLELRRLGPLPDEE